MCVNNLPRVALDSGAAGIRIRDLPTDRKSSTLALYHQATHWYGDAMK